MAHNVRSDEQPESYTFLAKPFPPWSTTSAGDLRNAQTRRSPKASLKQPAVQVHTPRTSDDTIPSNVLVRPVVPEKIDKRRKTSEPSIPDVILLHAQSPPFSVPNRSGSSRKRPRTKTSYIHGYVSTRGGKFVCDRCSRAYESSGGTGAISRHLKKAHSIDTTASSASRNTTRERAVRDAAVHRERKDHTKAEEAREEPTPISLNRATLQRLYLSWVKSKDQHLALVNNTAFRNFLQYISPVANEMLPDLMPP